jgi:alpha-tubulin suppressor-like RCC1 family protein
VYGCGCNDSGSIGPKLEQIGEEKENADRIPRLIELPHGVDMISAGDCHSVAAHSQGAKVYSWGVYRNTNGPMKGIVEKPTQIGASVFNKPI